MTVVEYLKQGLGLDRQINYHVAKMVELRLSVNSIPSLRLQADKVQTSPSGEAPYVNAMMRVEELKEQINREMALYLKLKSQITEVIHQVKNNELQLVLMYKYLEGKTMKQIADLMNANRSTLYRWHERAIEQIILPEDAINIKKVQNDPRRLNLSA